MLKTVLVVLAATFGTSAALFLAPPRIFYSGFQGKLPFGSGIKVLPDGTNIWSWHHTQVGNGVIEVVVDFDNNGRMDTENQCFRVLVTDLQATYLARNDLYVRADASIALLDDNGTVLWELRHDPYLEARQVSPSHHLSTPLAIPIGSKLRVSVSGFHDSAQIQVHLIGRIVNI